jgi:hypothetical protein
MAVRTGTELKTDAAAVITALDTQIAAPNPTNAAAVVIAAGTLATNARDSRRAIVDGQGHHGFGDDMAAQALAVNREAGELVRLGMAGDARRWARLKRNLVGDTKSIWNAYSRAPLAS